MKDFRDSWVMFKLESDLSGKEYVNFVGELIFKFLLWCDPSIDRDWARHLSMPFKWNEEAGLSVVNVGKKYVTHVKMYLFDAEDSSPKSILFRDHYSEEDVEKVYCIADSFEEFLKKEGIRFSRVNKEIPH